MKYVVHSFQRPWIRLVITTLCLLLIEFGLSDNSDEETKYDLDVDDLNEFCPLVPGFEEFEISTDSKVEKRSCFKYHWIPDPCTMNKSGRIESNLLHCGHYSMTMTPCLEPENKKSISQDGSYGFNLPWEEVVGLCDNVVKIKGQTTKKRKNLKPTYWKWTFCENDTGTELRPCGHYSMETEDW